MKPVFATLPIDSIEVRPQLRTQSWGDIAELARMIEANGFVAPIVVFPKVSKDGERGWVLVAGERRLRACKLLKREEIPAQVISPKDARATQLQENLGRVELHWLELADGFAVWELEGYTQSEIARLMGTSPSYVNRLLRARQGLLPETLVYLREQRARPPLDLALRWSVLRGYEKQKQEIDRWLGIQKSRAIREPPPEGEQRATVQTRTIRSLLRQALSRGASAAVIRTLQFLLGKGRNPWKRAPGKHSGRPPAK